MNVDEVLSFKPDKPNVLFSESNSSSKTNLKRKRRLDDDSLMRNGDFDKIKTSTFSFDILNEKEKKGLDVQKILEDDEESEQLETLDEMGLKRLILQFEKKVFKNQEMRIKYPGMPEKFMESEIELNDIVQEMHIIATMPEFYNVVVDLNTIQTLVQLLGHENTDIAITVVDLLQEMTDIDAVNDMQEEADVLIDALLQNQVLAMVVQNLDRLDETNKEESEGVHNSLAILENLTELRPSICLEASTQGFLQWILERIKSKMLFDANKLYCSELLSILLQTQEENRQTLGELDGIDLLLAQLAIFKRHDPTTPEEIEFMENLFGSLCSALMLANNRARFLKGEGLQLMNLMLREKKKMCKTSALKVLDHAISGEEGIDNCNKFVDILGLRSLFPFFMKPPSPNKKAGPNKNELEEHILSIISSLIRNCDGSQRQRLLNKFVENDHEKVDRLVELHFKYLDKTRVADDRIDKQKKEIEQSGSFLTEDDEDDFYLKRLEAGLFTLQLIDYIMLEICHSCPPSVRSRVLQIMNLRGGSIKAIKSIMREYAGSIGDANTKSSQRAIQERVLQLIDRF